MFNRVVDLVFAMHLRVRPFVVFSHERALLAAVEMRICAVASASRAFSANCTLLGDSSRPLPRAGASVTSTCRTPLASSPATDLAA